MTDTDIPRLGFRHSQGLQLDFELLTIQDLQQRIPKAWQGKTNRADFFRLIGITSGSTTITVDFTPVDVSDTHWLLIRPGQAVRYDFERPWGGWMVLFRPESMAPRPADKATTELDLQARIEAMPSHWVLTGGQAAHTQKALQLMYLDYHQDALASERNALMRFQLAGMLLRLSLWQTTPLHIPGKDGAALAHFKRFCQQLERDFMRHHQVQHYAHTLGLSHKTLNRACTTGAGIAAKAFIAQRLCLEAKRLLAHTAAPVQNIASDLGFDEATNFVKFFKTHAHCTPTDFRKRHTLDTPLRSDLTRQPVRTEPVEV